MYTVNIHVVTDESAHNIALLPFCEMKSSGRRLCFYHRLTQRTREYEGSIYLTAALREQCMCGTQKEQLVHLFSVWCQNGEQVLRSLMEEGYLG